MAGDNLPAGSRPSAGCDPGPARGRPIVAIDGRKLAHPNVGIGQYVYEVARRLPGLAPDLEFVLLTDRPIPPERCPDGCRIAVLGSQRTACLGVSHRTACPGVSPGRSRLASKVYSPFWLQVLVPRYLRRARVALFHGANFLVPVLGRCRSVLTVHDMAFKRVPETWTFWYRNYMSLVLGLSLRKSRASVVVSDSAGSDLVELAGVSSGSVVVAHHGVGREFHPVTAGEELSRVRTRLNLPERFVLHVGTIERRKNLDGLVRAMAPLLRENLVDTLVLAGGRGYACDAVIRAIAESGVENRVLLPGHVVQEDLPALYSLATAVAFPSWYEGFGLPVLEAMACGTPVLVSNVSSLPEVAGDAALLVSPHDRDAMTEALRRILTDSRLRAHLRERGFERAKKFTWQASAARHVDVYRRVLNGDC